MIKNVLRNAQSKTVGIFVKSFVSTEIWKSIMNFNHTVLILNSVPNTLKRLQVLLQVGNWAVGCICVHGILNKLPKEIKSPSSARLQYHLLGYSSKLSKDASPVFFFVFFFLFFFLLTTEGKGNAWTYFYFEWKDHPVDSARACKCLTNTLSQDKK